MEKLIIDDDLNLILFNPGEFYTLESAKCYIANIGKYKVDTSKYKRFLDFSEITEKKMKYSDVKKMVFEIKKFRFENSQPKACLYCKDIGQKKLVELVLIQFRPEYNCFFASTKLEECAEYLDIGVDVLEKYIN